MKLNKKIRCQTVTNMLVDMFTDQVDVMETKITNLIEAQLKIDNKEHIDWYSKVPTECAPLVRKQSSINARFNAKDSRNRDITRHLHPFVTVFIGSSTGERWEEKRDCISEPFKPHKDNRGHSSVNPVVFESMPLCILDSPKLTKLIENLYVEKTQLESVITTAGYNFYEALLSVTSKKKLEEVMPEAVKYLPKPVVSPSKCTDMVSAELYASINTLLGKY